MRLIYFIVFLLILEGVYGEFDINLEKEKCGIGETLQIRILFEDIPLREISNDNIYLYKDNKIKVSSFLYKLNEKEYYSYFNIPNVEEGNYSVNVKLLYKIDNRLEEVTKIKDVVIEGKGLSINPALVSLDEEEFFKINLKNNGDEDIEVEVLVSDYLSYSKSNILIPGQENRVLYVYPNYKELVGNIELILRYNNFDFKIPVLVEEKSNISINDDNEEENAIIFLTQNDILDKEIYSDQTIEGSIKIKNNLNKSLFDLKFSLTGNLDGIMKLNISKINEIKGGEIFKQYLWVNKDKKAEVGKYEGELKVKSKEGYEANFPVSIQVIEKVEEDKEEYENYGDEEFDLGEEDDFVDGFGFLGGDNETEEIIKEGGMGGKWITIILIILFMLFGLWFVYSKTKPKKSFKDVIK